MLDELAHSMVERTGPIAVIDDAVRLLVWIPLLALTLRAARRGVARTCRKASGLGWIAFLTTAFCLALALRWVLPPWAPLHAGQHGIGDLRWLASAPSQWHRDGFALTDPYGAAYGQLAAWLVRPFHGGWRAALGMGAVFGAAGVVLIGILAARVTGNRTAGAIAALGLATDPSHIALSLSESPLGLAGTLYLGSLAAFWSLPAEDDAKARKETFALGALALAAAVDLHLITLVLPMAVLAAAAPALRRSGPIDRRWLFGAMAIAGASMLLHLLALMPLLGDAVQQRGALLRRWLPDALLLRGELESATLVSRTLRAVALLGAGALVFRGRGLTALGFLLATVLLLCVGFCVAPDRSDVIRYQTMGHLLLFVLAGASVTLAPWTYPATRWTAAAVIAAVVVVPSRQGLAVIRRPLVEQGAFDLVVQSVSALPARLAVLTGPRHRTGAPLGDFPEYVLQETGHDVEVIEQRDDPGSPVPGTPTDRACYVWLGPSCFSFDLHAPWPPTVTAALWHHAWLRHECAGVAGQIDPGRPPLRVLTDPPAFPGEEFTRFSDPAPIGLYPCLPPVGPERASPR